MPQELQVLRCYSCQFFQVHIVKKSRKWECKVCGEKQSIKKVYGKGSGQDCRTHVQTLNKLAVLQQENEIAVYGGSQQSCHVSENDVLNIQGTREGTGLNPSSSSSSKWSKFLDKSENEDSDEANSFQCIGPPKQTKKTDQWSDGFQNRKSKINSADFGIENEGSMHTIQSQGSENRKHYQNHKRNLYDAQNSIQSSINDTAGLDYNVKRCENFVPTLSETRWFKYMHQETNAPNENNLTQVSSLNIKLRKEDKRQRQQESLIDPSVSSKRSKWHIYLEEAANEEEPIEFVEASSQMINSDEDSVLPKSGGSIAQHLQETIFMSTALEAAGKQMFSAEGNTTSLNATTRDISIPCNTFDRDYDEDELNNILDL